MNDSKRSNDFTICCATTLERFAGMLPKGITVPELNNVVTVALAMLLTESFAVTLKRHLSEKQHLEFTGHVRDCLVDWLKSHPRATVN